MTYIAMSLLKSSPGVLNRLEVGGFCVFALIIQEIGPSNESSCAKTENDRRPLTAKAEIALLLHISSKTN